jgi:hypothetical protein
MFLFRMTGISSTTDPRSSEDDQIPVRSSYNGTYMWAFLNLNKSIDIQKQIHGAKASYAFPA